MSPRRLPAAWLAVAATALVAAAPAAADSAVPVACNPNATLLNWTDGLNKAKVGGVDVGGLSALALDPAATGNADRHAAWALVDNQGTTPARMARLQIDDRADTANALSFQPIRPLHGGPDLTGANFDGEGLVRQSNGRFLASSETEPSIYRLDELGRVLGKLPVPDRFRVKPAGEATVNQTFEGLGLNPNGHTLWAGMEGPLSGDGVTEDGRARLRFLRYARTGTDWKVAGQTGYLADPGLGVAEVQVVNDGQLLVLERGFTAGLGNTIRIYQAFTAGADDVSGETSLSRPGVSFLHKQLLVDLSTCPSGGATNPGTQANPLLDNVEGMALGRRLDSGVRELHLISDDNFSVGQVTRLYRLAVRLRPEPQLRARATYSATQLQPGPTSGNSGVDPNNGQTPPFAGQPVPGISGALRAADGAFWGMPDNGFGTKANSGDFLLRLYHVIPRWKREAGGAGQLVLDRYISLHTKNWLTGQKTNLTGNDYDIESVQRGRDGSLFFGDEFGPYLLHTAADGRLLHVIDPPAGVRSPQSATPASPATLPSSRGWEALAASSDNERLYAITEAALTTDGDQTLRHVYEFDVTRLAWTGRTWTFHTAAPNLQIGDAQKISGNRLLFIERDDLEGPAAKVKQLRTVDLDDAPAADGTRPTKLVLDLLRIRDPWQISWTPDGGFGLSDVFSFPLQSVETVLPWDDDQVLLANDNNFPDSNGRVPGKPDDLEAVLVDVPGAAIRP